MKKTIITVLLIVSLVGTSFAYGTATTSNGIRGIFIPFSEIQGDKVLPLQFDNDIYGYLFGPAAFDTVYQMLQEGKAKDETITNLKAALTSERTAHQKDNITANKIKSAAVYIGAGTFALGLTAGILLAH